MATRQVNILIGGRVQGVGFRYFVRNTAFELKVNGWVRNTRDGRVEIEASGKTEDIAIFIDWIKIGPPRAYIQTFALIEIAEDRGFMDFVIR
jgi:acylphosphatase